MVRFVCVALAALSLVGCATRRQLPDEAYVDAGRMLGASKRCFEANLMSPQLYANTERAIEYRLASYEVDQATLIAQKMRAWSNTKASPELCRNAEAAAFKVIAVAGEIKSDRAAAAAADQQLLNTVIQNGAVQKPIYCNRIGNTTMCQ